MTALLKGQAVNVGFASTTTTRSFGSIRLSSRAQVAPAKPPPITMMVGPTPWAIAGNGMSAAAAAAADPRRNLRRSLVRGISGFPRLAGIPFGDHRDLVIRESFRDAVHDGGRP